MLNIEKDGSILCDNDNETGPVKIAIKKEKTPKHVNPISGRRGDAFWPAAYFDPK